MAIHSSILAWTTPWTEEPGGVQPMGHKESDRTEHAPVSPVDLRPLAAVWEQTRVKARNCGDLEIVGF